MTTADISMYVIMFITIGVRVVLEVYGGKYATFNLTNCYYKPGPATGTGYKSYRVLSTDPTARAILATII